MTPAGIEPVRRIDGSHINPPRHRGHLNPLVAGQLDEATFTQCQKIGLDLEKLEALYQQFGEVFFKVLKAMLAVIKVPDPTPEPAPAPEPTPEESK